ncbi:MAG: phage holin family protein [Paludibacteraceae bacterium]|nr:phage holin family protein [Paludibacteraceae bacterium]
MDEYKQLLEDSKAYLRTRYDLLRLELLDKLSLILGLLVLIIVLLVVGMGAIAYFSVALVGWLSTVMSTPAACCLLGGVLVAVVAVLWLCRQQLFINPFVKLLSGILFRESEEEKEAANETAV